MLGYCGDRDRRNEARNVDQGQTQWDRLSGTDLSGANLSLADRSWAKRISNEELEQEAESLEGATMPNGQKYEDWLKSKGRE